MKLQTFNGGLNTIVASHLLQINEGAEYLNIENESGELAPVKKKATSGLVMGQSAVYFEAQQDWVHTTIDRDYLEYQDTLYYASSSAIPKSWDGTTERLLGIEEPNNTPAIASFVAGVLTGTYQYVYTYYNSAKGIESPPSPVSAEAVVTAQNIQLDGMSISSDLQVDKKLLYRVGGTLTEFALIATIDNAITTYLDGTADADIPGDLLVSETYYQAPLGLQYLIEAYGILFGALGDKLYFTIAGKPWAWPRENFIDFPYTVTGIGKIPAGIIVFTRLTSFIITGTNPTVFVKRTLSEDQGCTSHKSIKAIRTRLLWVSLDGVCETGGTVVNVVSKTKLGKVLLDVVNSVVYNEQYYIHQTNGKTLVLDYRYEAKVFKELFLGVTDLTVGNNLLLGYDTDTYYELFADSANESMTFKSALFSEGAYTNRKNYNSFYVKSEGEIEVKVYVDKALVKTKQLLTDDVHEIRWDQRDKNGYALQFTITGTGSVQEVDFQPLGRQTT